MTVDRGCYGVIKALGEIISFGVLFELFLINLGAGSELLRLCDVINFNRCTKDRESLFDVESTVVSSAKYSDYFNFISWLDLVNIVACDNCLLITGDTTWLYFGGRLLNRNDLMISIDWVRTAYLERTWTMARKTTSKGYLAPLVRKERAFQVPTSQAFKKYFSKLVVSDTDAGDDSSDYLRVMLPLIRAPKTE